MTVYEKYKKSKLDLSVLGFEKGADKSDYFCTPKGAKVIGWAGVDGIHFCFISDFEDTVFAVNPMGEVGAYVHPIAKSFEDLLRLLLSCGHTAYIEQAHAWDKKDYDAFAKENPSLPEQEHILEELKKTFSLTPIEDPFEYIKALQRSFDYSKIEYKPDYYEWIPARPEPREWKVYFGGGFGGCHAERERHGKEIKISKSFVCGDKVWHIPSVYSCSKGLVADIIIEVSEESMKAYLERYANRSSLSYDEIETLGMENPLNCEFSAKIILNSSPIPQKSACGSSYIANSLLPEGESNDISAENVLSHYGFDPQKSHSIHRISFPWVTDKKPKLNSLKMFMEIEPTELYGSLFTVTKAGEKVEFMHPITGEYHTLTVTAYEQDELDSSRAAHSEYEIPTHYTYLEYTLSPDLPNERFRISDIRQNDSPKKKTKHQNKNEIEAVAIGIIGKADSPKTLKFGSDKVAKNTHSAHSAILFKKPEKIEWRAVFREKLVEDIEVDLI